MPKQIGARLGSDIGARPTDASRLSAATRLSAGIGGRSLTSEPSVTSLGSDSGRPGKKKGRELTFRQQLLQRTIKSSITRPSGVFALHIKQGRIYDIDSKGRYFYLGGGSVAMYLRVFGSSQCKMSGMYVDLATPATVNFDCLMHFDFTVYPTRDDAYYFIRFELVAFDMDHPEVHRILGVKEMSMLELIQSLFSTQTVELWKLERLIADVTVEFAFAYGTFGFGYSNVFRRHGLSAIKDLLQYSMFCRLPLPDDRLKAAGGEVMQCSTKPVEPPELLFLTCKTTLQDIVSPAAKTTPATKSPGESAVLVNAVMRDRMIELRAEFSQLTSRRDRLDFLRRRASVGRTDAEVVHGTDELEIQHQPQLKRRHSRAHRTRSIFGIDSSDRNRDEAKLLASVLPSAKQWMDDDDDELKSWRTDLSSDDDSYSGSVVSESESYTRSTPSDVQSTAVTSRSLWQRIVSFFTRQK